MLANYSCQSCRPSECPRSGALRMYHTKEMGRQLGIHGFLRFCRNFDLLVVWAYRMGFNGYLSLVFLVPSSVLTRYFNKHRSQQPISIPISHFPPWLISSSSSRRNHHRPHCWCLSRSHELPRLYDIRPTMDHSLLHRFEHLGRWLPIPNGRHWARISSHVKRTLSLGRRKTLRPLVKEDPES